MKKNFVCFMSKNRICLLVAAILEEQAKEPSISEGIWIESIPS